jgi:hypothetical protein
VLEDLLELVLANWQIDATVMLFSQSCVIWARAAAIRVGLHLPDREHRDDGLHEVGARRVTALRGAGWACHRD